MVLRELVTKLSFSLDRTNLDKMESAILGFKTKFSLAAAGVAGFSRILLDFTSNIARTATAGADLADIARIPKDEFFALENVITKAGIAQDSFRASVSQLSTSLIQAKSGFGDLFKIAEETGLNFYNANGSIKNTKELLISVFNYINSLPSQSDKLRVLSRVFSAEDAGKWLRLIEKGTGELIKAAESEQAFGKGIADSIPEMIKLLEETQKLNSEWDKLSNTIAMIITPFLAQSLQGVNLVIEDLKNLGVQETLSNIVTDHGMAKSFDIQSHALGQQPGQFQGQKIESLEAIGNHLQNFVNSFSNDISRLFDLGKSAFDNITITNNIDVNVPSGGLDGQASVIAEEIKIVIQQEQEKMIRQIQVNNPQVE